MTILLHNGNYREKWRDLRFMRVPRSKFRFVPLVNLVEAYASRAPVG